MKKLFLLLFLVSQNVSCENNFLKASGLFLGLIGIAHSLEINGKSKYARPQKEDFFMPAAVGLTGASLFIAGKYFCK